MTERTPLRSASVPQYDPQYVFSTGSPGRLYRQRVRQFQCCVCATVLSCFVLAIVIAVAYSVNSDIEPSGNGTTPDNSTGEDALISLLTLQFPLADPENITWDGELPSAEDMEEALQEGQKELTARDTIEVTGPRLQQDTPSYRHQMAVKTGPEATRLSRSGFVMDVATRHLAKRGMGRRNGTDGPVGRGPSVEADWMPEEACADEAATPCPHTPYRSADGSCNHPLHPYKWGVAMRPFRRTLPPDYADGVSAPRAARDGSPLPSARDVSVTVHRPMHRGDPNFTVMLAVWGQFIDHDITATALNVAHDGGAISCCQAPANHPECFPVMLDSGDPYFHQFNLTCMEFVRSAPAPMCTLGHREQFNQASAFLDGSVVYGPNPNLTKELRSMEGGKLRMSVTPDGRSLLPYSSDQTDGCNQAQENAKGRYCFASGDARANENLHLTTMHLLWARQHNLLADRLSALNPNWTDERLFQEARRIVSAQFQHITFSEFLPILLGKQLMSHLDLNPQPSGYYHGYDATVDPSIANSFAAAAFRFAHTLLPGLMKMVRNGSQEYVELHRMLFNPYTLYNSGNLDDAVRGALETQVQKVDPYFTPELTQHLFEKSGPAAPCGLDLVSLNIQRGRDHGLPPYVQWREKCGLKRPKSFSDMKEYVAKDSLRRMSELYETVEDVDLYTGGLAESPIPGGFLGPTITCLIADQFVRIKKGDRFWYESPEAPQAFTAAQLRELRKTTLARIICDTSDHVTFAQPYVMRTVGPGNRRVSCNSIPEPDLSYWKEPSRIDLSSFITTVRVFPDVVGGHISSGHVVSDSGTLLWDGKLPLALPAGTTYRPRWSGKLDGTLLEGSFSLPVQTKWVNGKFSLELSTHWNRSGESRITGTFTSPVYFKEVSEQEPFVAPIPVFPGEWSQIPSVRSQKNTPVAQIVLEGQFSKDRQVFLWNGDFIISLTSSYKRNSFEGNPKDKENSRLSNAVIAVTGGQENSTNSFPSDSGNNVSNISSFPSNKVTAGQQNVTNVTSYPSNSKLSGQQDKKTTFNSSVTEVNGTLVSGGVTSDGDKAITVNGPLPLSVKSPRGIVLQWNGSVTIQSSGYATLQGIFADMFFNLIFNITPSFNSYIGGTFLSTIQFTEAEEFSGLRNVTATPVDWSGFNNHEEVNCTCKSILVTLLGAFSDDKSEFFWNGSVSLQIPNR